MKKLNEATTHQLISYGFKLQSYLVHYLADAGELSVKTRITQLNQTIQHLQMSYACVCVSTEFLSLVRCNVLY